MIHMCVHECIGLGTNDRFGTIGTNDTIRTQIYHSYQTYLSYLNLSLFPKPIIRTKLITRIIRTHKNKNEYL